MNQNEIKALVPVDCPHCHKTVVVEFISNAPNLVGVYTPEVLEAAKQEALKQINALNLPEEISKPTIDWINNPETIFGPGDIQTILDNLKNNPQ